MTTFLLSVEFLLFLLGEHFIFKLHFSVSDFYRAASTFGFISSFHLIRLRVRHIADIVLCVSGVF